MKPVLDTLRGVLLFINLVFLATLLVYEKRKRSGSNMATTIPRSENSLGKNHSQTIGRWLRILCIASFTLCVFANVNCYVFSVRFYSDSQCTAPRNIAVALYNSVDFTVYLFLWLRQYLVYKSINLQSGKAKTFIRFMQRGILFLFLAIFSSTAGLVARYRRYAYNATMGDCYRTTSMIAEGAISYIWSIGSLTLHSSLVFMFAFPIINHAIIARKEGRTAANKESGKRMMALVCRCLTISIACVASDVVVMLVTLHGLPGDELSGLRHLLFNVNVVLNSILIVISFKEWPAMIFPCVQIDASTVQGNDCSSSTVNSKQVHLPEEHGKNKHDGSLNANEISAV